MSISFLGVTLEAEPWVVLAVLVAVVVVYGIKKSCEYNALINLLKARKGQDIY